jgi:Domain of unknown function (DUF1942)
VTTRILRANLAFVIALVLGSVCATAASAFPNAGPVVAFGTQVPLEVRDGVVIAYTVTDLKPSTDEVEAFRVGHLWEATLTARAVHGAATPILPFFNARAHSGRQYRILFQAAAADAISPDAIPEGATSTGKIYFDCNGTPPAKVVYNDGGQDLLTWANANQRY